MAGKNTRGAAQRPFPLKRLLVTLGSLSVLIACVAFRYWNGPEQADAGAPQKKPATASRRPIGPVRQTQAATAKSPVKRTAPTDQYVAIVNEHKISRQFLARETVRRFGPEVLETMINKQLILEACKTHGIVISPDDVNAEVQRTAKKWGMSSEHYLKMLLKERHIEPDKYREDIVWPSLALRQLAGKQLHVSQEEINKEWESRYGEAVETRMIIANTQEKAAELHKRAVANPDDFGKLALDHSSDPVSASARGIIPPILRHKGEIAIEQAVFALQPGEISPVVYAADQYIIFKCEKRLPPTKVAAQYKQQAIAQITDKLRDDKLREKSETIFTALQKRSKVVNVYNDKKLAAQMPGIVALVNNHRINQRQLGEEAIARFGVEVLQREIDRQLLQDAVKKQGITVTSDEVMAEVARAAEMFGFLNRDGTPDVNRWLKEKTAEEKVSVKIYVYDSVWPSAALRKLVASSVKVTDEDLDRAYQANYGERIDVQAIVVGSQRRATEIWQEAKVNEADKEFFGRLAHEYSIEPVSRENYGLIPPIRNHSGEPLVEAEAFKLQPGKVSGVVAVGGQFVILRCLGRTLDPDALQFAEVKSELHADILDKKIIIEMNKVFARIQDSARIVNGLTGVNQRGNKQATAMGPRRATPKSPKQRSQVKPANYERKATPKRSVR